MIYLVLGEPNFRHLADVDTPSGFSSAFESSNFHALGAPVVPAETSSDCSNSLLSSNVRDGAGFLPASQDAPDVSIIPPLEVPFCPKCGDVFQS